MFSFVEFRSLQRHWVVGESGMPEEKKYMTRRDFPIWAYENQMEAIFDKEFCTLTGIEDAICCDIVTWELFQAGKALNPTGYRDHYKKKKDESWCGEKECCHACSVQ